MKHQIKIAFAHHENGHIDKGLSQGVTNYIRNHPNCQLIPWPDTSFESLSFLKKQGCHGAIVNIPTTAKAQKFLEIGMPIIAYSTLQDMGPFPYISTDSRKVAKLAFEYLSNKQFKNFAFFGLTEARWTSSRLDSFSDIIAQSGNALHVFSGKPIHVNQDLVSYAKLWIDTTLKQDQAELVEWLRQLPKPTAILVSCDILGCHLSHFAREAEVSIPNDIAILGIDNNEALCNICTPSLSSIVLNLNKAGSDAAELLMKIISGKASLQGQQIKVQPMRVRERASTDIFAIDDQDVVAALKFIYSNREKPLQVEDIARHVCLSKRSLQMKFHQFLNTSIHDEIINAHFLLARSLLLETDLSIEKIAIQSGFHYSSNMRRAFMDLTGQLPNKYRQTHRTV